MNLHADGEPVCTALSIRASGCENHMQQFPTPSEGIQLSLQFHDCLIISNQNNCSHNVAGDPDCENGVPLAACTHYYLLSSWLER